jgi:hypothetical protein
MDLLAVKISIPHNLRATYYLGVELKGAVHILDRDPEVLYSLQADAERFIVSFRRRHVGSGLCCRGSRQRNAGRRESGDHRGASRSKHVAATTIPRSRAIALWQKQPSRLEPRGSIPRRWDQICA